MRPRKDWTKLERMPGKAKVVPAVWRARSCLPLFTLVGHHHVRYLLGGREEVTPNSALRHLKAGRNITFDAWRIPLLEDIEKAPDQIDVSIACGGLCCRRFFLDLTPDELACPDTMARMADGAYIADMVIPLETVDDQSFYTCRHLREDGLCGSYETRPQMCRAFPYGEPCPFPGCPSGVPSTP